MSWRRLTLPVVGLGSGLLAIKAWCNEQEGKIAISPQLARRAPIDPEQTTVIYVLGKRPPRLKL